MLVLHRLAEGEPEARALPAPQRCPQLGGRVRPGLESDQRKGTSSVGLECPRDALGQKRGTDHLRQLADVQRLVHLPADTGYGDGVPGVGRGADPCGPRHGCQMIGDGGRARECGRTAEQPADKSGVDEHDACVVGEPEALVRERVHQLLAEVGTGGGLHLHGLGRGRERDDEIRLAGGRHFVAEGQVHINMDLARGRHVDDSILRLEAHPIRRLWRPYEQADRMSPRQGWHQEREASSKHGPRDCWRAVFRPHDSLLVPSRPTAPKHAGRRRTSRCGQP